MLCISEISVKMLQSGILTSFVIVQELLLYFKYSVPDYIIEN